MSTTQAGITASYCGGQDRRHQADFFDIPARRHFISVGRFSQAFGIDRVIPAEAGIQEPQDLPHHGQWIPAFAGMTESMSNGAV
jgi:hypothetical protein